MEQAPRRGLLMEKKPKAENLVFRYLFSFLFQEEGELLKRYGLAKQAGFQVQSYF